MFWGGKKKQKPDEGHTVLIVDVENGSVGVGLARLSPEEAPRLFGEHRVHLPINMSRSGVSLAEEVEGALSEALHEVSQVASRVRQKLPKVGSVDSAAAFMAPPWGRPNLENGKPDFLDGMRRRVGDEIRARFSEVPVAFYTSAGLTGFGSRAVLGEEPCLTCNISGEMSELLHMDEAGVRGHATIPLGSHALARTLRTHGGLSPEEARSAARLPFETKKLREPFAAHASDYALALREAARELMQGAEITRVRVIAQEPLGEWYARALSESDAFGELFPNGGEIRALRSHQIAPHLNAHAPRPDLHLMLGALFVDSLHG